MEKYRTPELDRLEKTGRAETHEPVESFQRPLKHLTAEQQRRAETIAKQHEIEYRKQSRRYKWIGGALAILGLATVTTACPFYAFALIGPETVLAGLGLLVAGGVFLFRKPKIKNTNRALMIALRNGNSLTVSRLALEMDVSFAKAEKIIQELVRSGVAEIDLDRENSDHSLIYRIKGL